jgi:nucleotide-binding universal stress UspA family protein
MNAIKNILLPTDFSEGSKEAALYALQLANKLIVPIKVMHVVDFPPHTGFPELTWATAQMVSEAENHAHQQLIAFTKELGMDVPISYHLETRIASPSEAICTYARKENIDLIVIAKHGRKGLERLLLGSVTERVIRQSHCPVFVIPVFEGKR